MDESAATAIREHLEPHERFLWSGRPRQGICLRASDLFLIPFSLMWGGFAFYWEYSVLTQHEAPRAFSLWGVPFVLAGLYITAGRFFVDAMQRERTFYGISHERVLIVSGLFWNSVTSLHFQSLADISLTARPDGSGTITFGSGMMPWAGVPMSWPGMPAAPSFDLIPDARTVYELIREAQRDAHRARMT